MERHDLLQEFPEYQDKIHRLKVEDEHFKELYDQYDELAHEIQKINTDVEVVTDEHAHELKAKLLFMKDELFSIITQEK
jgi:hypothetical protein